MTRCHFASQIGRQGFFALQHGFFITPLHQEELRGTRQTEQLAQSCLLFDQMWRLILQAAKAVVRLQAPPRYASITLGFFWMSAGGPMAIVSP